MLKVVGPILQARHSFRQQSKILRIQPAQAIIPHLPFIDVILCGFST
jgi:hypothetical protein